MDTRAEICGRGCSRSCGTLATRGCTGIAPPESAVEFDEEIHSEESSGSADPEIQVVANADKETVHRALEELPAIFREVLVLREIEGMSYKEIADVASVSLGTVMSRLARARTRLRESLGARRARSPDRQGVFPIELQADTTICSRLPRWRTRSCRAPSRWKRTCAFAPNAREELERQQALRATLQRSSFAYAAPSALRERIQSSLRSAVPAETPELAGAWRPSQFFRRF